MISLSVTSSTQEVVQQILLSQKTLSDWTPFFEAWGIEWRLSREEMWDTGGASTGTPWPFYSRATKEHQYAAAKSSMFSRRLTRRDLLTWNGRERLKPSFTKDSHPENVEIIQGNSATYGSRVPYARNHDEGRGTMPKWAGGYRIPRRPLLTFGIDLEMRTQELADRFAAAGVYSLGDDGKARSGLTTAEVAALLTGAR